MDYDKQLEVNEELRGHALKGDIEAVSKSLSDGAEIDAFDNLSHTALHYAIESQSTQLVHFLITEGANVNMQDEDNAGNTPIAYAAQSGLLRVTKMLLRAGADPYLTGNMGLDALHRAQECDHPDAEKICQAITKEKAPPKRRRR